MKEPPLWKTLIKRLFSFWDGHFSGASPLNFRGCYPSTKPVAPGEILEIPIGSGWIFDVFVSQQFVQIIATSEKVTPNGALVRVSHTYFWKFHSFRVRNYRSSPRTVRCWKKNHITNEATFFLIHAFLPCKKWEELTKHQKKMAGNLACLFLRNICSSESCLVKSAASKTSVGWNGWKGGWKWWLKYTPRKRTVQWKTCPSSYWFTGG